MFGAASRCFFQKSHFSPLNFIFLVRCLQSTKKWFRARTAFGLTIHHPAQNKNEIHLQKKNEPRKKVPKHYPLPIDFKVWFCWINLLLVPGCKLYCWQTQNNYFRFSTLYFFFEIRKPFDSKNLYGRVKRRWISIFETMEIHHRLAGPIEDLLAHLNAGRTPKTGQPLASAMYFGWRVATVCDDRWSALSVAI